MNTSSPVFDTGIGPSRVISGPGLVCYGDILITKYIRRSVCLCVFSSVKFFSREALRAFVGTVWPAQARILACVSRMLAYMLVMFNF